MALKGLDSSKHSGVISTFNREFVKTGVVGEDGGRVLQRLFDGRTEGDYRDLIEVDAETARKLLFSGRSGPGRTVVDCRKEVLT